MASKKIQQPMCEPGQWYRCTANNIKGIPDGSQLLCAYRTKKDSAGYFRFRITTFYSDSKELFGYMKKELLLGTCQYWRTQYFMVVNHNSSDIVSSAIDLEKPENIEKVSGREQ